jgi:signal peptidase II
MKRLAFPIGLLVAVAGLVGCDQTTKRYAERSLAGGLPTPLVKNVLELRYTENRGVAFSAERWFPRAPRGTLIVAIRPVVLLFLLALWWAHRRSRWPVHAAFALTLAGALGNLLDGVLRGYVIDFVHLRGWPIFNLADMYITAGLILLCYTLLWPSRAGPPGRQGPPERDTA